MSAPYGTLSRWELEEVMAQSRVGKRNRALILQTFDVYRKTWEARQSESLYWERKYRDVVKSLKDRDRHITNLEAIERERLGVG